MMANINRGLTEETGLLEEDVSVEEGGTVYRRPASDMERERGRKGGQRMEEKRETRKEWKPKEETGRKGGMREERQTGMQEGCEGLDLNRKQSIDDLSCGRIKKQ